MRALMIAALIATTLTGGARGLPENSASTRPLHLQAVVAREQTERDHGPCDEDRYDVKPAMGAEAVHRKVAALIRCAVRRWSVEGGADKAIAVATCESGLWPWAVGGDNLGVFQHKATYWFSRVNRYLRERWFNAAQWERVHQEASVSNPRPAFLARANVLIGIRMAHSGGWGPWSCA